LRSDLPTDTPPEQPEGALPWPRPAEPPLDGARRVVHIDGAALLKCDALLLALGARAHVRYAHAITLDDARLDEVVHGLIQDVEGGYVRHIAFACRRSSSRSRRARGLYRVRAENRAQGGEDRADGLHERFVAGLSEDADLPSVGRLRFGLGEGCLRLFHVWSHG
jgi:hypothetical protein